MTNAQRQQILRDRRKAGLVRLEAWVPAEQYDAIKAMVDAQVATIKASALRRDMEVIAAFFRAASPKADVHPFQGIERVFLTPPPPTENVSDLLAHVAAEIATISPIVFRKAISPRRGSSQSGQLVEPTAKP